MLQSHWETSFICVVRRDAKSLAEQIVIECSYVAQEDDQP
jgi:hypothetical protein